MPSGEILKLDVKVLSSEQKLTYAGNQLEDSRPLAFCNIGEDSVLEMLPSTFQIFVKYGKTLVLDALGEDKVSDVKSKIHGLPDDLYYLVFAGKALKDDQDLASYFIRKDSHLHIYFFGLFLGSFTATLGYEWMLGIKEKEYESHYQEYDY
ncbi:hypothetical protein Acr_02g0010030 [Actinidia rufa]|uniref:Ubiquitin-like domain-containing protein n=1 Tax=Actinidia rufa TaxID=165716 RepID=A0A7J0E8F7_9ERIC|nr:hypothetical protein Acr_02g0010030 [Actinidia rufa]